MIVPRYWAEAKRRERKDGRQVTVRRFGWSNASQDDAQILADQRCLEALQRILSGDNLAPREPRTSYNGASGVPIREEIIETRGDSVVTRNSYGALCLNTPDTFFADIDLNEPGGSFSGWMVLSVLAAVGLGVVGFWKEGIILILAAFLIRRLVKPSRQRKTAETKEARQQRALEKIRAFSSAHPSWNFRVYRTPAGFRAMATHDRLDPRSEEVAKCFEALGTDQIYRNMCVRQNCFRARVSPKPWRIGIGDHIRPRPGTWPVKPEFIPPRNEWIRAYDVAAVGFASCEFIESVGSGVVDSSIAPVLSWHDQLSRAESGLPIA